MRIVCTLLFAAAAATAACVSTTPDRPTGPPGTVAANNPSSGSAGSDMVCHEVNDTGSLFTHTECEPKDDEAARRDNDTRWLKHPMVDPSSAQGGQIGGGPVHN